MHKQILLFTLIFSCLSFKGIAQKEIQNGIFLYGKLENTIHGNILVAYKIDDPESESIILDKFEDADLPIFSYHDYFFPHVQYEVSELDSFIRAKDIETIIYVTMKDVGTHSQTTMSSFYSDVLKMSFAYGKTTNVIDDLTLVFEIHNRGDGFKRPVAVLQATGENQWGSLGSFQSTLYKTMRSILKTLDDEAAFGGEKKERGLDGMDEYINKRK